MELSEALIAYRIIPSDIENIQRAASALMAKRDDLVAQHYQRLMERGETKTFLSNPVVFERAKQAFEEWFDTLLAAKYDGAYLKRLNRIGQVHVKIGLPAHHVNIAMNSVRAFIGDVVHDSFPNKKDNAPQIVASFDKIIDLNLDIMTRSYREAELSVNFLSHQLDNATLRIAKWFVNGFNMTLVMGLIIAGVMAFGLAIYDFYHAFAYGEEIGPAVLHSLGSLLILWVVIELLDTQIKHIRGGSAFVIKVFVSVALVAELRKVLVMSVEEADWVNRLILTLTVVSLGLIYWLVSRMDRESR